MHDFVKRTMRRWCPDVFHLVAGYRFHRQCRKRFGRFQNEIRASLFGAGTITVLSGPFTGLRYFNRIVWGPITPKWIGSYESELHGVVQELIQTGYATIVDIGAAEGYYAVGLARRCPDATVITFDVDPLCRRRQKQLAELNGAVNVRIHRRCSTQKLGSSLTSNCLVICDIEGDELDLLDPLRVPNLENADILVEVHSRGPMTVGQARDRLSARFHKSHRIRSIQSVGRGAAEWKTRVPGLSVLDDQTLKHALNEHRGEPQCWLWMKSEKAFASREHPG